MKDLLFGSHPDQKAGTFKLYKVKNDVVKKQYDQEDLDIVFEGDSSKGSALFGWGLACWLINKMDRQPMMLFNNEDEVAIPDNATEE